MNSWAKNNINEIARIGIISGYDDKTFKPDNKTTRAEAVKMINNLLYRGELHNADATFEDLPSTHWASGHGEESIRTHRSKYTQDGEWMIEYIEEPLW